MAAAMAVLSACGPGVPQLGKSSLDEVIGAMTLEEKAHLVVGTGMAGFSGDSAVIGATRKLVPGAAGTTYPIERLGIPAVVLADGPAGLRIDPKREGDSATYYCTHFPIGTLLASTWDQELVESVGQSIIADVPRFGQPSLKFTIFPNDECIVAVTGIVGETVSTIGSGRGHRWIEAGGKIPAFCCCDTYRGRIRTGSIGCCTVAGAETKRHNARHHQCSK